MNRKSKNTMKRLTMEKFMRSGGKAANDSGRVRSAALWLGVLTIVWAGFSAHSETQRGPLRSRAYKLRHIDSSAAKELLLRLKIGAEYNTLSQDVLIVTSDQALDLTKVTSVLTVADREAGVEIRPLLAFGDGAERPRLEELAVRLRSLTLGTLTDGPPAGVANPAIVDVFDGMLIGIGSPEALAMLERAIDAWRKDKSPTLEASAAAEPAAETSASSAEPQPAESASLADVAAMLFGDAQSDLHETDPNTPDVVEDAALEPAPGETARPAEAERPADAETGREADSESRRTDEAAARPDDPRAFGESLRAMLEMRRQMASQERQMQEQAEAVEPLEAEPAEAVEATTDTMDEPTAPATRIVSRPALPDEKAEKELELTITLPEEVEIVALLELVGKQLGLNYMYDSAIFQGPTGKIMLKIHDGRIRVSDLYSLLESVLRFRGFVMTRRDRLVTIVRQQEIGNVDPVLRRPDEAIQPGDVMVSSVFQLKHVNPTTAQNLISQMRLGTSFNVIPESGTLIITDYAFRMERIREVISMIDVVGPPKDFQFRQLRYMQAGELAPKVKALASQIQGVTITVAGQPTTPATPATPTPPAATRIDPRTGRPIPVQAQPQPAVAAAAAAAAAAQDMVYLEADDRTNRVLMIGYPAELETINQLIDSLDVAGFDLRFVKEYIIQYVEATDVITVLNELGLARVTVGGAQAGQQAARQPVRPGQQLTPQQAAAQQQQQLAQQQQQQMMMGTTAGAASISEPYISLRAATNSLLVNATSEQHKAIELVISHVDVIQKDQRMIREYEIQYVDTQSILDTLGDLGIITPRTTTAAGTAARATAGQQQAQPGRPQPVMQPDGGIVPMALPTADGTEREITAQEPQIAVLPATNSLLIHATPRQHAAISMVVAHADRQRDRLFAPYVVYALENQDPKELAEVLNTLIKETVEQAAAGTPSAPDARIQTRPTQTVAVLPSGEEQRIRIVPDEKTYSLIVYANPRNQQWIGDLIRELDEYRPQVLLDVTLVEITKNDAFTYNLDLLSKTYGGAAFRSSQVGSALEPFTTNQFLDARSTSGSGIAFFNSENVQALLEIVENKGYGRIMAKPKLLVNDNQEGEIKTENTTSIAQQRSIINPATGTSPESKTVDVSFNPYSAGVTLKIRPHISKGNMLRLEITLNRTDFTERPDVTVAGQTYPRPPDLLSTEVTTVGTVPDGTTIILGGLESVNQGRSVNKVPILGDLPLLGGLFRGINNSDKQSRLYVFVKANILRPGDQIEGMEDMRRVSERNRRAFEMLEERFQQAESWPGIKERPLDPTRALEED